MRVVGQERVADAFGVAPKTIVEWQEEGFPVAVRGSRGVPSEYDLPACVQWLIDREVRKVSGPESARDRLWRLQADREAIALAKDQGRLVAIDEVEPKWTAACIAAREHLLRARRTLAAKLDGITERRQREDVINEVHEAFLRRLAEWRTSGVEGDGEGAE